MVYHLGRKDAMLGLKRDEVELVAYTDGKAESIAAVLRAADPETFA